MKKNVFAVAILLMVATLATASLAVPSAPVVGADNQDKSLLERRANPAALAVPNQAPAEIRFPGRTLSVPPQLQGQNGTWTSRGAAPLASLAASTVWVDDSWVGTLIGGSVGGHIFGTDAFATIQDGIDNVLSGGTVNVYPGNYSETAAGRTVLGVSGTYQFGLFIATYKSGITVRGVNASGVPIASYGTVVANVQTNATNSFGPSGVFVEGDNVTITGLNIFQNPALLQNKTVEVIGDNLTIKYCQLTDGNSLYLDDLRYDVGTNTSWVKSYTIDGNLFTLGTSIDLASGAGYSGPVTGRKIINNSFDLGGASWNAISFNGSGTGVPWFIHSVGGAIITGNSFANGTLQYMRARGDYDNSQFDWQTYFTGNTYDRKSVVVNGGIWANSVREFSYVQTYTFLHVRRIGSTIQGEIDNALAGDEVLVGDGTYVENLIVSTGVKLTGSGASTCTVIPALSAPNPGGGSLPPGASNIMLVQADNVTISGFTLDGNNPSLSSGVSSGGIDVDARNGIITNHNAGVYTNLTVHHTTVKNIYLRGMYASSGGTFWFHHNTVHNVFGEGGSIGMFNFGGSGTFEYNVVSDCNDAISSNHSKGCQFLYNTVTNSSSGVHTDNAGDAGGVADLIKGNVVSDGASNSYGVWVFVPYIAPLVTENTVTNCDVGLTYAGSYAAVTPQFTNNVVNGMARPASTGVYITTTTWWWAPGNCSVQMSGNEIKNNVDGFYFEADAGFTCTATLQNNNISGNSGTGAVKATGTMGLGTFALTMTSNWWGAVSGPLQATTNPAGAGNSVDNGIKYSPWVASSGVDYDLGTTGWQPDMHFVGVSTDGTIQEGVNLVAGSTIYIAAGTYAGQVVMTGFTDLKLIGAGIGSTIVTPPVSAMTHYFMTSDKNYAILSVEDCASTKISHLTVDGLGKGNGNYRFVGIGYHNSGGSVDTCAVLGVRDTPFSGAQHGIGMYAYADNGTNRTLAIRNTTVSGFQKGGIVLAGVNLSGMVDRCTVTGAGPTTVTAQNGIQIGPDATGMMSYNNVSGISYTGASWAASGLLAWGPGMVNADHNTVSQCQASAYWTDGGGTVSNNTFSQTPAGTGHQEFYGFLGVHGTVGAAAARIKPSGLDFELSSVRSIAAVTSPQVHSMTVRDNVMDGAGADTSFGVEEYAYGSGNVSVNVSGNRISNYYVGVELYKDGLSPVLTSVVNSNVILHNDFGMDNVGGGVNAQYNTFANGSNAGDDVVGNYYNQNCWNDYSGSGAYAIGGGGGNQDNNPNRDCGLNMTADTITYACSGSFQVTYSIGEIVRAMDFIRVKLEFPAELNPGTPVVLNANYSLLPSPPPTSHGAGQKDTMQIDMIVLSGSQDGPANLFRIPFAATSGPAYPSYITEIDHLLRDSANATILVPPAAPTVLLIDCSNPTIVVNSPAPNGYFNHAPTLNLTATDNLGVSAVYYQIDACTSGGWQVLATGLSGTTYNNPSWPVPNFGTLSEAAHCIHFKVVDQSGHANSDSCTFSWCFTKDITPPAPPTNFVAKPGHNKVHLTWTNSSSSDVAGVRVQRAPWTDYPEFGSQPTPTPAPAYPANQTTGTTVLDTAASASASVGHVDASGLTNATRDIYYFGAFAYDAAGNFSIAASTAQGRSTSYWLGDIADNFLTSGTFDGSVYFQDLNWFSLTYGKKRTDVGFYAHADFGPTQNSSPKGIPMPDDSINFEDAIIFAINFDAVSPAGKLVPVFADDRVDGPLGLSIVSDGSGFWRLRLDNNSGAVKGVHAILELGPNTVVKAVDMSDAIKASAPAFFTWVGQGNRQIVIDLAILGQETTIGGSGDLATIELTSSDGAQPQIAVTEGVIRDLENQTLGAALNSPAVSVPREYSLSQNYPNPFNPATRIAFALPHAGQVKLEIFNVLGQRVALVVNEYREAGVYTEEWNSRDEAGRSVASGVYLYRLSAGEYTSTRKMILMK